MTKDIQQAIQQMAAAGGISLIQATAQELITERQPIVYAGDPSKLVYEAGKEEGIRLGFELIIDRLQTLSLENV